MRKDMQQGAWYFTDNGIAVPTTKDYANARLLRFDEKRIFLHWKDNYNLNGDFRTELMVFESYRDSENTRRWVLDFEEKTKEINYE